MFSNRLLTVELFCVVYVKYLKFAQYRDWESGLFWFGLVFFCFVSMIITDASFPFLVVWKLLNDSIKHQLGVLRIPLFPVSCSLVSAFAGTLC